MDALIDVAPAFACPQDYCFRVGIEAYDAFVEAAKEHCAYETDSCAASYMGYDVIAIFAMTPDLISLERK